MSAISPETMGLILICVMSCIGLAMVGCCCYACCCRPNPYTIYVYRHRITHVTPVTESSHDAAIQVADPVTMFVAEHTNTNMCVALCDSSPKTCIVVVNP